VCTHAPASASALGARVTQLHAHAAASPPPPPLRAPCSSSASAHAASPMRAPAPPMCRLMSSRIARTCPTAMLSPVAHSAAQRSAAQRSAESRPEACGRRAAQRAGGGDTRASTALGFLEGAQRL
jgi:hypothetical protein